MNPHLLSRRIALALIPATAIAHMLIVGNRLLSDETAHFRQIAVFVSGDFLHDPATLMLPGYHALVAGCMWLSGWTTAAGARTVSYLISLAAIGVFSLLARWANPDIALVRTAQFGFLPILFPFLSLIFTDVLGLALALTMILLDLRRRHVLAGIAGLLACLVRQNLIIWVPFSAIVSHAEEGSGSPRSGFARYWMHGVTIALFAVFVMISRAINRRTSRSAVRYS